MSDKKLKALRAPPRSAAGFFIYVMAESVMQVTPCHPSNVKYRMIEALEGLDDALDQLRVRRMG
jgi:hypothetical protein